MTPRRASRKVPPGAENHHRERKGLRRKRRADVHNRLGARIGINLKLYSRTKADRWDASHASFESSPNYTLTIADAQDVGEDFREIYEGSDSESPPSDFEDLIPHWQDIVDEHSEFDWLEVIEVEESGHCRALLVRKSEIMDTFWDDMEAPEHQLAELAFKLFDRFGSLKPHFKEHPLKRGSRVWGDELKYSDILLIHKLEVSPSHRWRGIGTKLAGAILELASKKSKSFIGIAGPGAAEDEWTSVTEDDISQQTEDIALFFWRKLQFRRIGCSRWLGYSPDMRHKSRSLAIEHDYDLPHIPQVPHIPEIVSLMKDIWVIDDAECLERLKKTRDNHGNTLLHLSPWSSKSQSTRWIVKRNSRLLSRLNLKGDTPLEALGTYMERKRTIAQFGFLRTDVSDMFTGFDNTILSCLCLLRGLAIEDISEDEHSRLKFSCTCNNCLGGFLSPRVLDMLLFSAETTFDLIYTVGNRYVGHEWCQYYKGLLEYLPDPIAQGLAIRDDMRTGFCMLWKYLATCLRERMLPTDENVLLLVQNANDWPPHCRNFIQKGGSISSAATMLFKRTMRLEPLYDIEKGPVDLPTCRNEREFGMVDGMCGYERVTRVQHLTMQGKKSRF
ncbi:hypothetical protein BDV33DRAFT_231025 [Aspergillus novoparasiticus]|uniref:N-acetyltransferase domain-containing protein n=1 Tax=Aspergillus novoparasiticus TaxID=986946 RepID=A0A5N6F973_9EURO|nr:hypothetical protein BDV33DRAFT_231025 [Aspergillus novoparasiticus]